MKILFILIFSLFIALPVWGAGAPPFPFTTYPPAQSTTVACQGRAVIAVLSDDWQVLSSEARDFFVHLVNGQVDYVYLTIGTMDTGPAVQRVLTRADAQRLYPDPCAYLTEVSA